MKYLLIALTLSFTACSKSPHQYVCFTPFTFGGGVEIDTSNPNVREQGDGYSLTTPEGNQIIIPRGQCIEVKKAAE